MKTPQVTNQNNNPVQILFTITAKLFSFQNSFEKYNLIELYEFNCYHLITTVYRILIFYKLRLYHRRLCYFQKRKYELVQR